MYCKSEKEIKRAKELKSINSSKVYCKSLKKFKYIWKEEVLIVAKCIVNGEKANSINPARPY